MASRMMNSRVVAVVTTFCLVLARMASGQSCPPQWATLGGVPAVDGEVLCSTTLASGEVVIGGTFTQAGGVSAANVARYDPATRLWSTLGAGLPFATVQAVTSLPNGEIVVGGSFGTVNGVFYGNIARYSPVTGTWARVVVGGQAGLSGSVLALLALPDGSLVVGGDFLQSGNQPGRYATILNASGNGWSALGSGVNRVVFGLSLLQSGEILALGDFTSAGANTTGRVASFNRASGLWTVLGNWQSGTAYCATQLPGGDVIVGGSFSDAGGTFARNIARYSFATNTWTDLASGVDNTVYGVAYRAATTDVVVCGRFANYLPGFPAGRIARFDLASNSWAAIGGGILGSTVNTITPTGMGQYFLGGLFSSAGDAFAGNCVLLGAADDLVPPGRTTSAVIRTALDAGGGSLVVAGAFSHAGNVRLNRIGRYDTATGAWTPMGAGFSRTTFGLFPTVHAVASLANGDIIAGGDFVESGSAVVNRVARYRSTTGQWEAVGSGATGTVFSLLPLPGNSFLAAGLFSEVGGVPANSVAKFNAASGSWESFGAGMPAGVTVRAMVRLPNGDVIVNGSGTTALRRYSATNDQWSSVGTLSNGFDHSVDSLLLLPTGRVVVGGLFSAIGGLTTSNVAVFDPGPATWSALGSANAVVGGKVATLLLDADGSIMLGGAFTHAGGAVANGIARFDSTAGTWRSFAPGVQGGSGVAKVIRAAPSSSLFVLGGFLRLGDPLAAPAGYMARVSEGGTPPAFTSQPASRSTCPGPVSFSVTATGTPTPTYLWRRNGVPLNTATNPTAATSSLVIASAVSQDSGTYDCVVTNACGTVTSQGALLAVCPADYDCTGGVDSDDVIAYFADWDLSDPSADFNGDGGVDADDVIGFFGRWDAGC